MSDPSSLSPASSGSLRRGSIHYLPVVPGKLEFAVAVRRAILEERPRVVAVELPGTLEQAYLRAVSRLPAISVIMYADENDDDAAIYIPVEPADPFVEAIRSAVEIGAAVVPSLKKVGTT